MTYFSKRIPSLDGLRAVSILLVISGHAYQGIYKQSPNSAASLIFGNAGFGVEIFFVISGFLITSLLLTESRIDGTIHIREFYLRRIFRILPAMLVFILSVHILGKSGLILESSTGALLSALTFTTNYSPFANSNALAHFWSLSVEEQFYLAWPGALFVALRSGNRKSAIIIAIAIIATAPIIRVLTHLFGSEFLANRIYYMFHTRIDALMFGCALALLLDNKRFEIFFKFIKPIIPWAFFLIFFISPLLTKRYGGYYIYTVGYTVEGLAIALFLLWAVRQPQSVIGRTLNSKLMVHLGKISYSLYLWQELALKTDSIIDQFPLLALLLSFALAEISYHFVERPGLDLRQLLKRRSLARANATDA